MPTIGKQGSKPLPGVYAFPFQKQAGVRIIVCWIGELQLRDPLLSQLITGPSFLNRHSGPSRR